MPALVSALNRVDLPTFGRQTMPHFKLFLPEQGFQQAAGFRRLRLFLRFLHRSLLLERLFLLHRLRLAGMELWRRGLHVTGEHWRDDLERAVDRLVDRRLVFGRRLLQDVVGDRVLVAGMADADAQAPVVVRAETLRDVLQAVVAGDAAALLHPRHAGREVDLVVHHQHLFGLDLEEAGHHLHCAAAAVPFSPSAGASPAFGTACSVVGTSAAGTAAAAVAASSSSVISCGTTTVATTGSSALCIESSTPFGSASSRACSDLPTARPSRLTSTNSGRSAGKQTMSSSFRTWLTTPPCSFTPGDFSALTKCSGTFMWIFLSLETRWKSMCCTSGLNGCMFTERSSTCSFAPARSSIRMLAWNLSFLRLRNSSWCSSSMLIGLLSPP